YDGGARGAEARSREASAAIADLNTNALARSIDAQIRAAAAQLTAAQAALAAARDAADSSRKSADETAILYRQGLAKAIELVDAKQMQDEVTAPGSIDAFQQVQITARVAGAVDKVAFTEGQQVKQGDPLVITESERYSIAVAQARAAVSKAEANQKAAQAALDR